MLKLKNSKGFTLVELILVILIVGILAGIVIPRITYNTRTARDAAANATVSAVNAMLEYAYVASDAAYPANNDAFTTFLGNTDYFPDGVAMPNNDYVIEYNTTTNRAYYTGP